MEKFLEHLKALSKQLKEQLKGGKDEYLSAQKDDIDKLSKAIEKEKFYDAEQIINSFISSGFLTDNSFVQGYFNIYSGERNAVVVDYQDVARDILIIRGLQRYQNSATRKNYTFEEAVKDLDNSNNPLHNQILNPPPPEKQTTEPAPQKPPKIKPGPVEIKEFTPDRPKPEIGKLGEKPENEIENNQQQQIQPENKSLDENKNLPATATKQPESSDPLKQIKEQFGKIFEGIDPKGRFDSSDDNKIQILVDKSIGHGEKKVSNYLSGFKSAFSNFKEKRIEKDEMIKKTDDLIANLDKSSTTLKLLEQFKTDLGKNNIEEVEKTYQLILKDQDIIDITNGANLRTAVYQFKENDLNQTIYHFSRVNDPELLAQISFSGQEVGFIYDLSKNLDETGKIELEKVVGVLSGLGDFFGTDGIQSSEIKDLEHKANLTSGRIYEKLEKLAEKYGAEENKSRN